MRHSLGEWHIYALEEDSKNLPHQMWETVKEGLTKIWSGSHQLCCKERNFWTIGIEPLPRQLSVLFLLVPFQKEPQPAPTAF